MIQRVLTALPLLSLFAGCARLPPPPPGPPVGSLLERALDLFAAETPGLDPGEVRRGVAALAADAGRRLRRHEDAPGRVEALNRFFFEERGFSADDDLRDPDNLLPDRVLRRRRGYCTGLALLYAAVAERIGMPVFGVNTPDHLFLRYDDGLQRINIETQDDGRAISDASYRRLNGIPASSIERGIFLANLDDDRFLSHLANNLGTLRSRAGEAPEAIRLYRLALRLDPLNPTAHYNLAAEDLRGGRLEEARRGFSRALGLHPGHVAALTHRGVCRLRLGDPDGAVADFLAALAIDPAAAEARRYLETVVGDGR